MSTPIAPDPWVSRYPTITNMPPLTTVHSQAMPHINYSLRQAGHSDTVADELTRSAWRIARAGTS